MAGLPPIDERTMGPTPADGKETAVRSPLHGTVVAVTVRPGDEVTPGRGLLVLEAMKMEHVVAAPGAGIVTSLAVQAGDTVAAGALLATLDPRDHDGPGGPGPETADPAGSAPTWTRRSGGTTSARMPTAGTRPPGVTRRAAAPPARTSRTWSTRAPSWSTGRWSSLPSGAAGRSMT